jgi:hypothetical protein
MSIKSTALNTCILIAFLSTVLSIWRSCLLSQFGESNNSEARLA